MRTRVRTPGQNGSRERGFGSLKYERLFLEEIDDALDLVEHAEHYRIEDDTVRPHEAITWDRPSDVHLDLADPRTPTVAGSRPYMGRSKRRKRTVVREPCGSVGVPADQGRESIADADRTVGDVDERADTDVDTGVVAGCCGKVGLRPLPFRRRQF